MHNFKYALKTLLKNKTLIFWTYAFPIILSLLFNLAFSNIENEEKLDIIDIAIVQNEKYTNNEYYQSAFKILSDEKSDTRLFNIKYTSEEEAVALLEDKKITGYICFADENKIVVNKTGYQETIMNVAIAKIIQNESIINDVINIKITDEASKNQNINNLIETIYAESIELVQTELNNKNTNDITKGKLGYTMIEFYTLIAMSCLYGGIIAATALNQNLANMSNNGKRIAVSPMPKAKIIITSVIASYIVEVIGVLLLFLFTILALKVDYGSNLPLIILEALIACFAGLSLGIFVSSFFKTNEAGKVGIIISITMCWSFLSGMMGITLKYYIDKNIPIISKINPAAMITDGFYSLYYYDTLTRYWFDIISLLIFAFVLIGLSIYKLRGQKYDYL